MLDTVKLRSPYLPREMAAVVESQLHTKTDIDNSTGKVGYEIVCGTPEGSFEYLPHVNIRRKEIVAVYDLNIRKMVPVERQCEPYMTIEGSVHKALLGHNVFGGPLDLLPAARWYVQHIGKELGVILPGGEGWRVQRVDWAEAYEMGAFEACEAFVRGMRNAHYARRKPRFYGNETAQFGGDTTAFKVYHKGPEFGKHDYKKVKKRFGASAVYSLQMRAHGILRLETSIKARKLKLDYGHYPLVSEISRSYMEDVHDREASRVIREGKSAMETVRTHEEVQSRLVEVYGQRRGTTLMGTWIMLSAMGEERVKRSIPKSTFYDQRKQITDAGCSWKGGDIVKTKCLIPAGFSISRDSKFRLREEAPEVVEQLRPFAAA